MSDTPKHLGDLSGDEANRLKREIFRDLSNDESKDDSDSNYPETIIDKVSYAEHTTISSLDYIGWAIQRLTRFHRMLVVAGDELPKVITFNEARVAHERLMHVKLDIDDAISMMEQVMGEAKQEPRNKGGA